MQGYNYREISEQIPYTTEKYISRITQILKLEVGITDEDIETARFNRNEKRRMEVVLKCLKRGLSYKETAEFDKSLQLTEQQYVTCKKKLIESGEITEKEIKEQRELTETIRKAEREDEYEGPLDKEIIRLTKENMKAAEIARQLGVAESYVSKRKSAIKQKEQQKKRGISREDLANCLRQAKFPEEQIQRILNKELKDILKRASIYRINKILRVLQLYRISPEAIEKSIGILVDGNPKNLEKILKLLLDEFKISQKAVENCLSVVAKGQEDEMREIFKILLAEHSIKKEKIEACLTVLSRGKADEIREIFEVLDEQKITEEAIENCLSVLARGNASEMREIFKLLVVEQKISKTSIEGALSLIAKGKADNVRKIFEVLDDCKIQKNKIEGCLSILLAGNADEIRDIIKTLQDNGIDKVMISNSLYVVAVGKLAKIQAILAKLKKCGLEVNLVLRRGLKMLLEGEADSIEKIILTLQSNEVRNELIEEELSAIVNSSTPEEIALMFNDKEEPKDKETHYINVRRYMKLKELYDRVYTREEVEILCEQKHLGVREFISEIVAYPRGKDFTDIYYEKLMNEGTLYIGGSTDIDRDYQEEHGEELIRLSKKVANTFTLRTRYKDRAELEGNALEIILTKCGNLVYNLSHRPDDLKAAMFNKTISFLYSVANEEDKSSLTVACGRRDEKEVIGQRDISIEDDKPDHSLESSINYEKAKFDKAETQVMQCMVKLVEARRSG